MTRDFKGVWIPAGIWLSEQLTLQEKVLLAEIDSLDNENGCYASNDYFAEFFKLSNRQISRSISNLKDKGYIKVRFIYREGTKMIEKRIIKVDKVSIYKNREGVDKNVTTCRHKRRDGMDKSVTQGIDKNGVDNNPSINNTINNTDIYIRELFSYWNEKGIIKHRELTQKRKSVINARLKSYSVDEIKQAIDNYKQVLNSADHYWSHSWSLEQFMNPSNIERFTNEAEPLEVFLDKSKRGNNYTPTSKRVVARF